MCFAVGLGKGKKRKKKEKTAFSCTAVVRRKKNNTKYFCLFFSSFKHMIGCLEDVSCKSNEDADAKAK